jgi:hypothetical protein
MGGSVDVFGQTPARREARNSRRDAGAQGRHLQNALRTSACLDGSIPPPIGEICAIGG